jgi:hypothetical protein
MNSASPVVQVRSRKSEDTYKGGERSRSSSVNQQNGSKRSGSVTRAPGVNGLNSHPVQMPSETVAPANRGNGSIPRSVPQVTGKPRANMAQAREARLPRESLADFADFIRSTGPPGETPSNTGAASGGNAFTRAAGPSAVRTMSGSVSAAKASIDNSRASTSTNPNRPR